MWIWADVDVLTAPLSGIVQSKDNSFVQSEDAES